MNKVILTGRFTRDPEIKYTNDGTSIARFSIAVNRRFVKEGSDQKADFLNCIAFGKSAEFIEKYFSKGMKAENPDRQLHQSRWAEGIHDRHCRGGD